MGTTENKEAIEHYIGRLKTEIDGFSHRASIVPAGKKLHAIEIKNIIEENKFGIKCFFHKALQLHQQAFVEVGDFKETRKDVEEYNPKGMLLADFTTLGQFFESAVRAYVEDKHHVHIMRTPNEDAPSGISNFNFFAEKLMDHIIWEMNDHRRGFSVANTLEGRDIMADIMKELDTLMPGVSKLITPKEQRIPTSAQPQEAAPESALANEVEKFAGPLCRRKTNFFEHELKSFITSNAALFDDALQRVLDKNDQLRKVPYKDEECGVSKEQLAMRPWSIFNASAQMFATALFKEYF